MIETKIQVNLVLKDTFQTVHAMKMLAEFVERNKHRAGGKSAMQYLEFLARSLEAKIK